MRHWLLAACLGLGLWACAIGRPGPGPDEGDLSVEREKELTADVHRQIRAQAPLISDPVVLDYLYELGKGPPGSP